MSAQTDDDFVAWVRARQSGLLRLGYLLTGSPHSAEDLVQTALAKAYLRWDRIDASEAKGAYVRRIMINENSSLWRRAWKRSEVTASSYLDFVADNVAGPDQAKFDSDLWQVVQGLPPKQRAAVVLRYYEQLSEAETAEVLGCSIGNVKSQTHRALATLRGRLTEVTA